MKYNKKENDNNFSPNYAGTLVPKWEVRVSNYHDITYESITYAFYISFKDSL